MPDPARKLRSGFTTGTAAAAAAKGAVLMLVVGRAPGSVEVTLPGGGRLRIPLHACRRNPDGTAACTVVKDAGDDPDVTHGAEIGARARLLPRGGAVRISAGAGVGRVTKPGLDLPPGEPAINPVPRRMIAEAVAEALAERGAGGTAEIEVFVPRGEEIARRTLNARLGIVGGISILGTTGIVRPLSHDAFTATIRAALSVARAAGLDRAVLTTGRRSERFAQVLWPGTAPESFVQMGDHFEYGLATAAALGFARVTVAAFFGKAVKMAQGVPHTHAGRAALTLAPLAAWVLAAGLPAECAETVRACNTAREAFERLAEVRSAVLGEVGRRLRAAAQGFAGLGVDLQAVILDYEGKVVYDSHGGGHA